MDQNSLANTLLLQAATQFFSGSPEKRGERKGATQSQGCSYMNELWVAPRALGVHLNLSQVVIPPLLALGLSFHCLPPPQSSLRKLSFKALVKSPGGMREPEREGAGGPGISAA